MLKRLSTYAPLALLLLLLGCGSGNEAQVSTPEDRFNHAKALFENGDYLEAINEFTVVTLQYSGSAYAADAQFYIAECRFKREEFLLSAFEYSVVRQNYPASPRSAEAQYKTALSYYNLAPKPQLDQQYTRKAIDEFQAFVEYNPSHELAPDAEAKIRELTNRLAKKVFDAAHQYETMEYYRAALLSYDIVIEKYHDTDFAQPAFLDKADLLIRRERLEEAGRVLEEFVTKYPSSSLRGRADSMIEEVHKKLGGVRGTSAGSQSAGPDVSAQASKE